MKKLEFRPVTITHVRTMMFTPTSETFEDKNAWIVGKHSIEFLNAMLYELQKEKELE